MIRASLSRTDVETYASDNLMVHYRDGASEIMYAAEHSIDGIVTYGCPGDDGEWHTYTDKNGKTHYIVNGVEEDELP